MMLIDYNAHVTYFSAGVFRDTFRSLEHIEPEILYPIPDFSAFDQPVEPPSVDLTPPDKRVIFLSINRYERKKNLSLAIRALGKNDAIRALGKNPAIRALGKNPAIRVLGKNVIRVLGKIPAIRSIR